MTTLSIFKFERHAPAEKPARQTFQKPAENAPSSFGANLAEYEEHDDSATPRKMVLDLNRLTPETLDAFFPSESKLPKSQTHRNASARRRRG